MTRPSTGSTHMLPLIDWSNSKRVAQDSARGISALPRPAPPYSRHRFPRDRGE
ncbi:hypothetical protein [Pseudonocardia alaniniphila]|uniref:Uncharacterized protein n=1 Tax=Pseudonocardia alaniniphila TaxID=75291 RepID=A0ABS9TMZ7_9PSEU|nr:hypothetical protein [Pseudonocardia alaniniphila]MCH6169914.1 hypothetical protein [Pseudonocardia alaniniphila]